MRTVHACGTNRTSCCLAVFTTQADVHSTRETELQMQLEEVKEQ